MRFYLVAMVFLSIVSSVSSFSYIFHCRKIPSSCKNGGTCDDSTGQCTCATGFIGHDCTGTDITITATCPTCQNDGECYQETAESTTGLCACPYGFTGASCESEIVTIDCGADSAVFTVNFTTDFIGKITFVDKDGTELSANDCPATSSNNGVTLTATTNLDTPTLGQATCYEKLVENASTSYTAYFMVNYEGVVLTSLDDLFALTCNHTSEGFEISTDISGVAFSSDNLNKVNGTQDYSPVELAVVNKDDQALGTNPLALGEMVQLFLYLKAGSGYDTLRFLDCTANNTLLDDDQVVFKFLENSCPTDRGKFVGAIQETSTKLVNVAGTSTSVNGIVTKFNAFKFPNSEQIGVQCTAKFCRTGDDTCALPDCDAVPAEEESQKKRKKRATDDEERTVSKVFTVKGKNEINNEQETTQEKEQQQSSTETLENCMATPEITAVISILGAVVCLLLLACFLLTCCLLRKRGKTLTAYNATTMPQTTSDRFQIPRAHVNESFAEL